MDPGDALERDLGEIVRTQLGQIPKMDDGPAAVGAAEQDRGGRGRPDGHAHGIARRVAVTGEIREDQIGRRILAQGSDPTAGVSELRQYGEAVGDIAAEYPAPRQRPNLLVLGGIGRDLVDEIEHGDADTQHGPGGPSAIGPRSRTIRDLAQRETPACPDASPEQSARGHRSASRRMAC